MRRDAFSELEPLFDQADGVDREVIRDGVLLYRVKTIRSGPMLECVCYPIVKNRETRREAKTHITGAAQAIVNRRNSRRHLIRLAECNFTRDAVFVTLTYEGENPTEEEAAKELTRYLVRLRTAAKKNGQKLKYIAVIEVSSAGRVHHHILLEGVDRETAEAKWKRGYSNSRRFQENPGGFKGLVLYMSKWNSTVDEDRRRRRTRISQGMTQPRETISDHRMTKGRLERIAGALEEAARETLEKVYPGFVCHERPEVKRSEFYPGAMLYGVLWKEPEGPAMRAFLRCVK